MMANGLAGKVDRLLIPLVDQDAAKRKALATLKKVSGQVNAKRNAVVHQGEFCNPEEAQAVIAQAKEFVEGLMKLYDAGFILADYKRPEGLN